MKKIKSVIITILLFGILIGSLDSQDVLAGGSWKTAYSKFLSNPNSKVHGTKIADYDGKLKFGIKDLNADGIPELVCDISWIYGYNCPAVLYTFKNGKIKCAGEAGHTGVFYRFKNSSLFELEEQTWGVHFLNIIHTIS